MPMSSMVKWDGVCKRSEQGRRSQAIIQSESQRPSRCLIVLMRTDVVSNSAWQSLCSIVLILALYRGTGSATQLEDAPSLLLNTQAQVSIVTITRFSRHKF